MKRFKLLAIALAAVLVIGAVGCTSTREVAEEDYPVAVPYYNYGFGFYSPYYYGGGYYRPRTYIRTYPVERGRTWNQENNRNWGQSRGEARQRVLGRH